MSTRVEAEFTELVGKTIVGIAPMPVDADTDEITFSCDDGTSFVMWYEPDCCASASIEDVAGDVADLIGSPVIMAEVATKDDTPEDGDGMWTFYKLATAKGYVTLRWYGSSNGYYSISVSFARVESAQEV